jgi:hypothetical protein
MRGLFAISLWRATGQYGLRTATAEKLREEHESADVYPYLHEVGRWARFII